MAGLYYEDCEPGLIFVHEVRRTVGEADNLFFSALTHNPARLHLDAEYSKDTVFGQRLVNSLFILGLVTGLSVMDTTLGTTVANLGFDKVRFPNPVFHGDTIHATTEITSRRESKSRTDGGIVFWRHTGLNQREEVICECDRAGLMMYRPRG